MLKVCCRWSDFLAASSLQRSVLDYFVTSASEAASTLLQHSHVTTCGRCWARRRSLRSQRRSLCRRQRSQRKSPSGSARQASSARPRAAPARAAGKRPVPIRGGVTTHHSGAKTRVLSTYITQQYHQRALLWQSMHREGVRTVSVVM